MKPLDYRLLKKRPMVVFQKPYHTYTPFERRIIGSSPFYKDKDANDYVKGKIAEANKKLDEKIKED